MFSNRPAAPPGPGPSFKFTVVETCDRIKEEFNCIQQQNHSLHLEREKLISERTDMQRICVMYYEMANGLNLEMHRQMEIAKRLSAILTQVMPFLSQEHQSQVLAAIERAKQVTMQELNSVLAAQIEDAKSSNFFNGGASNLVAEQLEAFKSSALSGTNPSNLPSALHGLNMSHGGSGPGYGPSANTPNSMSGVIPSLSPPNNPAMSAALLNGLISAAGAAPMGQSGLMNPTSGSNAIGIGRDGDKALSNSDKQRAAAVAAANSLLLGGRSSGIGSSSLLPPPANPLSGILGANAGDFSGFPNPIPMLQSAHESNEGLNLGTNSNTNSQQPGRSASTGSGSGLPGGRHNNSATNASTASLSGAHQGSLVAPGISAPSNASSLAADEKRRKINDSRDSVGPENGNWFGNDEFRTVADKTSASSRRSTGAQQIPCSPQLGADSNASYPTTSSAPAVGSAGTGSGRSSHASEFSSGSRWRSSKSASGPGAYSMVVLPGGQTRPCALASAPGASTGPGLPRRLQHLASLPHGDVVCAVTIGSCPSGRASSFGAASDTCRGLGNTAVTSDAESLAESPTSNTSPSVSGHFAYTGARGSVKLWDLSAITASTLTGMTTRDITPLCTFDCLCQDSYVRSIKLFPDATHLIIGGESNALTLWDLNGTGRRKAELTFEAPACYALALSPNGKLCYSCCSDGYVSVWDVHNQSVVHQFHGHMDGTSCVEITPDGNRLWTGGLDHKVCCWDIRGSPTRPLNHIEFKSQVFSLGLTTGPLHSNATTFNSRRQTASVSPPPRDGDSVASLPRDTASPHSTGGLSGTGGSSSRGSFATGSWLAVGLESSEVEVVAIGPDGPILSSNARDDGSPTRSPISSYPGPLPNSGHSSTHPQHFRLTHHESCVLALRFAHHGDWFLTTGKDHQVNAWRTPYGACLLETKEAASVLTCDISPDDKFVVTGSGDKRANLYEVIFNSGASSIQS